MKSLKYIRRLDAVLKDSRAVLKSEIPRAEYADCLLYGYAYGLRSKDPSLSVEKSYSMAMLDCKTLAALAAGYSFNMATGRN